MSLMGVFDIAGSALNAQAVRLNTVASNLANAESISSSIDTTYRAREPVFAAVLNDQMGDQGVAKVNVLGIVESPAPIRREYRPDHPAADAQGYVYLPNVNVVEQLTDMLSASRSYQDNIEVANTAKTLIGRTLELGA
jgi:flagellar basal-body rod protein FlgC